MSIAKPIPCSNTRSIRQVLVLLIKRQESILTEKEWIDEREVETSDKMVLAALGDGSVVGIHLGTKKEVRNDMMGDYAQY